MKAIEITAIVEDMVVRLTMDNATEAEMETRDMLTGKVWHWDLTAEQAGCIFALLIGSDTQKLATEMYAIVDPIMDNNVPIGNRPIP